MFPDHVVPYGAGDILKFDTGGGNDTLSVLGSAVPITFNAGSGANRLDARGQGIDLRGRQTTSLGGTLALSVSGGSARLDADQLFSALSITGGGKLDQREHDVIIDYAAGSTSPAGTWEGAAYAGITGMIQRGHNGGTWNGDGLSTSAPTAATGLTALAGGETADVLGLTAGETALLNGFTVDASAVIVKYTYTGNANLDGLISGDDYSAIDFNIAIAGARGWYNGDFNYDGIISADDYSAIDFNIASQGIPL